MSATSFAIPRGSLDVWRRHLEAAGVAVHDAGDRFGDRVLACEDPDGMALELIEAPWVPVATSPVEAGSAARIGGFHSATLHLRSRARTESLLLGLLGFEPAGEDAGRRRFRARGEGAGRYVDTLETTGQGRGSLGAGSVHHIAWRTRGDATQAELARALDEAGLDVTPVQDRQYFRSVYFREPGGVLFEIATDPPGFETDESFAHLGESLKLPPWLEASRARIEQALPEAISRRAERRP